MQVKESCADIIGVSRPHWAFFLSFTYFLFPFLIISNENALSIVIGFSMMLLFFMGHFALNGIYDREADNLNLNKSSLDRWNEGSNVTKGWVIGLIIIFWGGAFFLTIWHSILFHSIFPLLSLFILFLSISYSTPPIQLKGRAPWDLVCDTISFGILGPFVAIESLMFPPESLLIFDLLILFIFTTSTVVIVVLPTIIRDTSTDQQFSFDTFSVKYGIDLSINIIKLAMIIQISCLIVFTVNLFLNKDYYYILMVFSFILAEYGVISPLFEHKTENVAKTAMYNLISTFVIAGGVFIILTYLDRVFGINFNDILKSYLSITIF